MPRQPLPAALRLLAAALGAALMGLWGCGAPVLEPAPAGSPPGGSTEVLLAPKPGRGLAGQVVNAATGEPVRDVRVTLVEPKEGDAAGPDGCACERGDGHWIQPKGSPWARTEQARVCRTTGLVETPEFTGDDGRFHFTGLRDRPHWIRVRYYGRRVGTMQVAADATEIRVPIDVPPPVVLESPAGEPPPTVGASWVVRADGEIPPGPEQRAFFPRYYPGAPVGFEGLAPGRHLLWIVANMRTAGQRDSRGALLDVEVAGQEPIRLPFVLEPAALLNLVVADARTGRAIAPATVTLEWQDRAFHRGKTDRYGRLTLESPAAQPVAVTVTAEGYAPARLEAASWPAGTHALDPIALQPLK
jgi:hypothetical protein